MNKNIRASLLVLLCLYYRMVRPKHLALPHSDATKLLAHRGLTAHHLENTQKALQEAFIAGADGVEFDVQLSRDLMPMIFHDRSLKRLTGQEKFINELDANELRSTIQKTSRYQESYPIATLPEVLSTFAADSIINIELKETVAHAGKDGIKSVLAPIMPHQHRLNIIISSFDPRILRMVADEKTGLKLGLLVDRKFSFKLYFSALGTAKHLSYIHPHLELINYTTAYWLKMLGISCIAWGHRHLGTENAFIGNDHYALISDVTEKLVQHYRRR